MKRTPVHAHTAHVPIVVYLQLENGKLVDNFSHESDVTSL